MRIVFKNSKIVFASAKWSAKGSVIKVSPSDVSEVALPNNARVYGRNLVDYDKLKLYTILNDAGQEVADSSSYFNNFIPINGQPTTLLTNYGFSRIYFYDENKNLFLRMGVANASSYDVPAEYNKKKIAWVKVQTTALSENDLKQYMVVMDESSVPTTYEPYQSNADGAIYSPYSWVWADDLSEIEITSK